MPPNDSKFWDCLMILLLMIGVGLWQHYGSHNGFDWKTDGPVIVALLPLIGGSDTLKSAIGNALSALMGSKKNG